MFSVIKQNNNITAYVTEFIADNEVDILQLPTNVAPGSKCRVISTADVWILNCSHQWIKSYNESGGSGGGGSSSGDEVWNDFPSNSSNDNTSSDGEWNSFN